MERTLCEFSIAMDIRQLPDYEMYWTAAVGDSKNRICGQPSAGSRSSMTGKQGEEY